MIPRLLVWLLAFGFGATWLRAVERPMRATALGCYVVVTDAPDKEAAAWIAKFDDFRRVAQGLLNIKDEQLLPLQILLLEQPEDFQNLTPTWGVRAVDNYYVLSVGLGQQPMIATTLGNRSKDTASRVRGATILWLLTSAGIHYDPWIVQGCLDFFETMEINAQEIQLTRSVEPYMKRLARSARNSGGQNFRLDGGPLEPALAWVALHYLLVDRGGWKGMAQLTDYQRKVMIGIPARDAFAGTFGLSVEAADQALSVYLKRGRATPVKFGRPMAVTEVNPQWQQLKPGVKDCLLAQFMLQMAGTDTALAREHIQRAAEFMAEDDRLYEAWWLYYERTNESSRALEAMSQAIKLGTRNHYIHAQWCIDVLNEQMLPNRNFLCDAETARRASGVIRGLIAANPYSSTHYKLLAQFTASITPADENDRLMLEEAETRFPGSRELIGLGLVAWHWRNGESAEAKKQLAVLTERPIEGPIAVAYADWLERQIGGSLALETARAALRKGDYPAAGRELAALGSESLYNPSLQAELRTVQVNVNCYRLYLRAKDYFARGQADLALSLLDGFPQEVLVPTLRAELDAFRKELQAKLP